MDAVKQALKRLVFFLVGIVLIATSLITLYLDHPIKVSCSTRLYEYQEGRSAKFLANDLAQRHVIRFPRVFEWVVRFQGAANNLSAGEYFLTNEMSHRDLIDSIVNGRVVLHELRIKEGSTIYDMIHAINSDPFLKKSLNFAEEGWFAQITTEYEHPEGLFMPDTYYFVKGEKDQAILKKSFAIMREFLNKAWEERDRSVNYQSPYQALIVASIVEKEASIPSERDEIAGVLVRRLAHKMRLQMDPTVIYALGPNFNGNLNKTDLKIDSPYNTYVHKGLPPTPIALPSRDSILSALHPAPGKSLYFVAKGDGSHHFSDSLEEHNEAVVKYVLKPKKVEEANDTGKRPTDNP